MASFETINYSVANDVASIKLNRPKALNAFNVDLRKELLAAVEQANADDYVRVVIIGGEGRGFCAGADLTENLLDFYESVDQQIEQEYKPFLLAIHESPKLYIAAVNGAAAGIGSSLAMSCDFIVMAEDAYIYQAFAAIGLVPDGGASWHLVRSLGYKRALQMIVESEKMPAQRALDLGLANKVVKSSDLDEATRTWAEKLAQGAPIAQRHTKEIIRKAMASSLSDIIDLEAKYQVECSQSEDSADAVKALFAKRAPVFKGK